MVPSARRARFSINSFVRTLLNVASSESVNSSFVLLSPCITGTNLVLQVDSPRLLSSSSWGCSAELSSTFSFRCQSGPASG